MVRLTASAFDTRYRRQKMFREQRLPGEWLAGVGINLKRQAWSSWRDSPLRLCSARSSSQPAISRDYAPTKAVSVPTRFWGLSARVKSPQRSFSRSQFFSPVAE